MTTCRVDFTFLELSETPAISVLICLSLGSLFSNTSNPIIKSSNLKENNKTPNEYFLIKRLEKIQGHTYWRFDFADMYLHIFGFTDNFISGLLVSKERHNLKPLYLHTLWLTLTHQAGKSFFLLLPQLAAPEWIPTRVKFTRSPFSAISWVKSGAPLSPWQGP